MAWPYAMSPEQFAEVLDLHLNRSLGGKRIEQETGLAERTVRQMLERWRKGELDSDELARVGIGVGDEPISPSPETGFDDIYPSVEDTFLPPPEVAGEVTAEVDPEPRVTIDDLHGCADFRGRRSRRFTRDGTPRPPYYDLFANPDRYVFTLACTAQKVTLYKARVESLVAGYASGTAGRGKTINEVAREQGLHRQWVIEILNALAKTHDSPPFTDERLESDDPEDLIEDVVRAKEWRVMSEAERRRWKQIVANAERWESFRYTVLEELREAVADAPAVRLTPNPYPLTPQPFVSLLRIPDLHYGKLGWGVGPGATRYDCAEAERRLLDCTDQLVAAVLLRGTPEYWLVASGDDFFHVDNLHGTTTKGTRQDLDTLPPGMLRAGFALGVTLLERLRAIAPVRYFHVEGNHDRLLGHALQIALEARYTGCDDVRFAWTESAVAYHEYGDSLLGFAHGDGPGYKELGERMAVEQREAWGRTRYRYWFTGHLHHEAKEGRGVKVYRLPTLSDRGKWEDECGYVLEEPAMMAFVIDKARGLTAQEYAHAN